VEGRSPAPGRSARPQKRFCSPRRSGSSLALAVELGREESGGSLEALVGNVGLFDFRGGTVCALRSGDTRAPSRALALKSRGVRLRPRLSSLVQAGCGTNYKYRLAAVKCVVTLSPDRRQRPWAAAAVTPYRVACNRFGGNSVFRQRFTLRSRVPRVPEFRAAPTLGGSVVGFMTEGLVATVILDCRRSPRRE
jgi:hypothetical protein